MCMHAWVCAPAVRVLGAEHTSGAALQPVWGEGVPQGVPVGAGDGVGVCVCVHVCTGVMGCKYVWVPEGWVLPWILCGWPQTPPPWGSLCLSPAPAPRKKLVRVKVVKKKVVKKKKPKAPAKDAAALQEPRTYAQCQGPGACGAACTPLCCAHTPSRQLGSRCWGVHPHASAPAPTRVGNSPSPLPALRVGGTATTLARHVPSHTDGPRAVTHAQQAMLCM